MATPNIVPRADSEGGLGTASKYWASAYIDLIYVGAGKIGRDADNLLDFSTDNLLQIRVNATTALGMEAGALFPLTSDGMGLGYVNRQWSDLFLASGAVINFGGDNVTLTHTSNTLTLADSDILAFGTGGDIQIQHNSTNSFFDNYVGDLYITNAQDDGDVVLRSDNGSGGVTPYITLDGSESMILLSKATRLPDNISLQIGSSGDLLISHDATNSHIANSTGDLKIINNQDNGDISFQSDNGSGGTTEYFRVDGGNEQIRAYKELNVTDNVLASFGNSSDLQIYHNATNSFIDNGTNDLFLRNLANDKDIVFQSDNGAGGVETYFYLDGSSAAHDGSATTALYTNWPDKSIISLGTSHDLQIYHNATNSAIDNATGDLYIQNFQDDGDIIFRSDNGSGGVTAYLTLEGTNVRTKIHKNLNIEDDVQLQIGNSQDLKLYHSSSHSYISQEGAGNLYIQTLVDDGDIIFLSDDGSGGSAVYLTLDGGYTTPQIIVPDGVNFNIGTGLDLSLQHQGDNSTITNNTGNLTILNNTNDGEIKFHSDDGSGGTTEYFRVDGQYEVNRFLKNARFNDNVKANFGTGDDLQIYHDGTNTHIANTNGNLTIENNHDDGDIIFRSDDGSGGVETYFFLDGSASSGNPVTVFPDNAKLQLGTDADLWVYSDGSNSYLYNNNGDLIIQQAKVDRDLILKCDDGSGGETAYITLDGSQGFTTVQKDFYFADAIAVNLGSAGDMALKHDGSNSFIQNNTGDLTIKNFADDGDIIFQSDDGSGGVATYLTLDGGDVSTIVNTIKVLMPNLPTSDPSVAGQLWNSSGDLKISAG